MYKSRRFPIQWLRLVGLLLSCLSLGVNTLRADSRIVVFRPANFDPAKVCGFDVRSEVWLYAEGANDTCIWEVTEGVGEFGRPITTYGNRYGDTIPFYFVELPVDGTVTVKMGKNSETVVARLELKQVKKAEAVADITWAPPICENIPVRFEIPVDEDYQTKYMPGSLHLRWTPLQPEKDVADGESEYVDVVSDDDFTWQHIFKGSNFKDGKVVVTPYTCDGKNGSRYRTNVKEKELTPFIVQGLYKDKGIFTLQKKNDYGEADDAWQADGSEEDPNTTICRNYGNDLWAGYINTDNPGYVYLGFGDYQAWMDAEDKTLLPEYYYSYEWSFSEDEFEYATAKMDDNADWGFGKGKSRIALRVLEGKTDVHTVKLTVRCDTCIARGGYPSDFTYETEIKLYRQDSISYFQDTAHPIDYTLEAQGNVCAGEEVVLRLSMDEQSQIYFDNISNAKQFTIDPRIKTPNGESANWEPVSSEGELHTFITKRTSWTGSRGDTIYVNVYPSNDCFYNSKSIGKNGKMFKVFVKNPPLPPVLYDPVTEKSVRYQYTDARWEDLVNAQKVTGEQNPDAAERFFVCNYTTLQDYTWINATQQFGLQVWGDSVFDPEGGDAFRLVDYDGVFRGDPKINYSFETGRRPDNPDVKQDSSWVSMSVRSGAREYFETVKEVKVGFYAYNNCGKGDTGIYRIRILDTLTTKDILSNTRAVGWDTLCEGMEVDLYSTSGDETSYYKVSDMDTVTDWPKVQTDRVEYSWRLPEGWKLKDMLGGTVAHIAVQAGPTSGPVRLRLGNRCGYGGYLDSNVFVHPFVRVKIVGDTTPCRGDTLTYRFKKADLAEGYRLTWPGDDWEQTAWQERADSMVYMVRVGDKEEHPVYVVGQKTKVPGLKPINETEELYGCNFQFNNYEIHNRDSLTVKIKHYTRQPIIDGGFPKLSGTVDTVCADNLYTFQVKKNEADDSVFFKWFFPDGWTSVGLSPNGDTADFKTPDTGSHKRLTVRVVSNRYDCAATNIGDTLDIPLLLMDTLAVRGGFADAASGGLIDKEPCEGDTVVYILDRKQDPSAYYALFDVRPIEADYTAADWNSLAASDWKILSEAPYHDTLKMVVGRDPMRLRAALVSHCDTSSFKEDTIRPIPKVIEAGLIEVNRPDEHLCEYEAVTFTFWPVEHATDYVFHYPWGDKTDTVRVADTAADREAGRLTDDGSYRISFADTFAYGKGTVYLEASNICGVRPDHDRLEIVSVLGRPKVPVLTRTDFTGFVYDAVHVIGTDTVMDSLCLRIPFVMEAAPNDVAEAGAAGWRFHYAWSLTQPDESVTLFKAYESADWPAGSNASDSLWMLTKEAGGPEEDFVWLTSRHETCERFGDTLAIALRTADTTALQGEDRIWNYLYDREAEQTGGNRVHIQTKPCATDGGQVAYYLDLSALDATGESYYFRWRRDSTEAFGNVYDPATKTIAGGKFVLNGVPADADGDGIPDWTALDTLKMTLPTVRDTMEIQVVVKNRCAEARMPGLTIQTDDAIGLSDVYTVVQVSDHICDEEKLTYKVVSVTGTDTADGVPKAGQYVWYTPWHDVPDTTDIFRLTFDTTAYKPGKVYVVPNNGCGDGHRSDSIEIQAADILQPPLRAQPVPSLDFAAGYDPASGVVLETLSDSVCLRAPFDMAVRAELSPGAASSDPGAPRDSLRYGWFTVCGEAGALKTVASDSSAVELTVPDFADSAYIIYVAARRSVCQRFGDSLRIDIFPMDTIRFIDDPVEDSLPYDRFTVLTRGAIQDRRPTPPVDTMSATPCVGSAHVYAIKPDFHWSLKPGSAPSFSWNGGRTGVKTGDILDGTLGWVCDNPSQLPAVLSVGAVGVAGDLLNLSVHAENICGPSVSKPVAVRPQALIDVAEQPVFKPLAPICETDSIWVEVEPVASATGYVWQASFRGGRTDTTAEPKIAYPDYTVTDGTITVYGFNACGDGQVSEPLSLKPLLRIPERPAAKWFDGLKTSAAHDTVYDTLCVHGNNLLWVEAAFGDGVADEAVFYHWEILPAYVRYAELISLPDHAPGDGHDSIYMRPDDYDVHPDKNLYLMVAARRASCRRWSDTLYIALHLTDTVSVSSLGGLRWYNPDTDDRNPIEELQLPFCPGTVVRIGVEHENAAPAYRWRFPDPTWRFADDVADTTAAVVKVVVGETEGVIRVSPMTDPDNRRCGYFAEENALTSSRITLVPALPAREFTDAFNATPCAGVAQTYEIHPPAPDETGSIVHYRWVFPQGWRVYAADGSLTADNRQEPGGLTCRVLPDSSAGTVKAYVVSKCGESGQSVSRPVERQVYPIDTARIELVADETVCKDSTLQIEVRPLNDWASKTGYGLHVTYIGSDAAVVTPGNPLEFDFPNAPDSSLVYVAWHSGDSVRITFTPRHTGGCPDNVLPVVYALKADTIPAIDGRIIGPSRVCMEAEVAFRAEADLAEGISVTYRWELPDGEGWEILQGGDSSEVLIRVGRYADAAELTETIRCYPRAFCGTAAPFEYTVTINPPAEFNGTLQAFTHPEHVALTPSDRPCIGSDLMFELTHADAPAGVRYVWETPHGWMRTTAGSVADSMAQAVFTASKAGADTVRVRFTEPDNPLSCGLSKAVGYAVAIRDSAPKARLTRPPYPCRTRTEVEFVVAPDAEIESAAWIWPADYDGKAEVATEDGSLIKDNKLTLSELIPGGGFTAGFGLTVRTTNICGSRDTAIAVRPVDKIPNLPEGLLHVSHYCPGDSAYAYADKLTDYVETGTEYKWLTDALLTQLQDSLVRENDDPAGMERVAFLRFASAVSAADTAEIRFYAQNDCNATDTVSLRTAGYTYAILARPGRDTVVYGQSGVALDVVAAQYGTPADYTYVWQPADRVIPSNPDAPDAPETAFATKGLYNRYEYFEVVSTERIDTTTPFYFGRSACRAHDTVMIFVDSTFAMAPKTSDTACVGAPFELSAQAYGGNAARYHFDWYRLTGDSVYEALAEAGHDEVLTLTIDAPFIRLMVVGRDTTLIYADGEEPVEPGLPEDDPEVSDDPETPGASDVGIKAEPLYVFSQVDTQYIELQAFEIAGRWILPGRDTIQVPFGTKVRLSAEAVGGGRQYVYLWEPAEQLERHDSTDAAVATLRLYDDCDATLTIRDIATGCNDTLRVHIGMQDAIGDIPNAFSPNGDGINDIFMKGTDLVIFDRFGQELFRSSEEQEGWDGTFKGSPVRPGDYLYVVTIRKNGREYIKKGTVTVFTK